MIGRTSVFLLRRGFSNSARRAGGHGPQTSKDMLPFNPQQNKWMLLVKMSAFMGSAFIIPFISVTYHLKRNFVNVSLD